MLQWLCRRRKQAPSDWDATLDLSVTQIIDRALGPADTNGARPLQLNVQRGQFRPIPTIVQQKALAHLEIGDLEGALAYVNDAFFVYRETVCKQFLAPLVKVGDVYEWPTPAKFSWGHTAIVNTLGEYFSPQRPGIAVITGKEGDKVIEAKIDLNGLQARQEEHVRDAQDLRDHADRCFLYRVVPSTVGFVNQRTWQGICLAQFSNTFSAMSALLSRNPGEKGRLMTVVRKHLDTSSWSMCCYVGCYALPGEANDATPLLT